MKTIDDPQHIGKRLKQALKDNNMSMQQLADACAVSRPAVSNWIKHGTISRKHVNTVARNVGTTVEWLLTGKHAAHNGHSIPAELLARRFDALPHDHQRCIWPALQLLLG